MRQLGLHPLNFIINACLVETAGDSQERQEDGKLLSLARLICLSLS